MAKRHRHAGPDGGHEPIAIAAVHVAALVRPAPVQLFTHDSQNYELSSILDRQTVIAQGSTWLTSNGVRHVFMDQLGDYIYARRKSSLSRASFDGTQLTYTFTGDATDPDGT